MPEVTEYTPGTAVWATLGTPNVAASKSFYRAVFGWDSYALTLPALGDYEIFTLGGIQGPEVAGACALADEAGHGTWNCFFRAENLTATLDQAIAAGASLVAGPTDVGDLARIALCRDTQGADFGLWQPYNLKGAGVLDEPGAMCWVELACPDVQEARRFYGQVFGWTSVDHHTPEYTNWKLGDQSVAGLVPIEESWPPGFPPHWIPYFWVTDCDAATARAADLGARVHVPPVDLRTARFSIMTDPAGARLALMTPAASVHQIAG